jgi:hypothetical protein
VSTVPDLPSTVFDAAIAEMRRRSKLQLYRTDFDAWAWDVLRMRNYEKIRQIAHDSLFGEKRRTLTKSGNGVGKSSLMSQMILWAGSVFDLGETVQIVSAPSIPQLQKTVFAYLKSYHGRVNADLTPESFRVPGRIDEALGWVSETPNGKIWLASGRKPPDQDAVSMFQGLRSQTGMTYVWFDEAGGMPRAMFTAAEAVMTGSRSRFGGIGNPDNATADWQSNFTNPDHSAEYNLHTISVYDTPVFTGERVYPHTPEGDAMEAQLLGALTSRDWVAHKTRIWATGGAIEPDPEFPEDRNYDRRVSTPDSPMKWDSRGLSKVMGEFPGDNDTSFFPQAVIDLAQGTTIEDNADLPLILGLDIARFGADESVMFTNRGGRVRIQTTWAKEDTVYTARRAHKIAMDMHAAQLRLDASGIGGGVFDMLKNLDEFSNRTYDLIGVDGGRQSSDPRRWRNVRAENHDTLRTLMAEGRIDIDIDDKELKDQLTNVTYKFANNGSIQITPKDDMKTVMGGSPDRLDALIYACLDATKLYNPDPQPGDIETHAADEFEMLNDRWWDSNEATGQTGYALL